MKEVVGDWIEEIFEDIKKKMLKREDVDVEDVQIDGWKFEGNGNKQWWVWKKGSEKWRQGVFGKMSRVFEEVNEEV